MKKCTQAHRTVLNRNDLSPTKELEAVEKPKTEVHPKNEAKEENQVQEPAEIIFAENFRLV